MVSNMAMTGRGWLTLAATLMLSVSAGAQAPPPAFSSSSGSNLLIGRVFDAESGSPVANAVVAMSVAGATGRPSAERVLTDARGRFFFSGVGAGTFTLTATKPGWIEGAAGRRRPAGASQPVEIRDGDRPAEIAIPLWRYAVITGRVLDESDEPLVATDVRIFQGSFAAGRRHWTFTERAITDDRGVYRFSRLAPGSYLVVVPAAVTSEPESLRGPNPLPMSYYQTMSPIGAAPMTFEAARMPAGGGSLVTSSLDLPRLPSASEEAWLTYPTTYFPSTSAIGTATVVEAVSGRERANVDVVMAFVPTFTVSGTLTAPAGIASGFHAVHLLSADSADNPLFDVATAVTDAAGAFTFYGVPPGQYIARIVRTPAPGEGQRLGTCGGTGAISFICTMLDGPMSGPPPVPTESLLHADASVTVVDRSLGGVGLELRPGVRVSGRAEVESGSARLTAADWRAMAVFLDPAGGQIFKAAGGFEALSAGRFSDDGEFAMPSTWPGRYVIRVTGAPPGWSVARATVQGGDASDTPLDLQRDVNDVVITLTNQATVITGTVRGSNGQPDEDASILLFPADPAGWVDYGRSNRRLRLVPASGGSFSMPAPPQGDYLLIALPDAQLADWQNPAFLRRAAALADSISVRGGQPLTHALRTRSLP